MGEKIPLVMPYQGWQKKSLVLCELCCELRCQGKSSSATVQSNDGVRVTMPFTNFGKLTERAKMHEFGSSKEVIQNCSDPVKYRTVVQERRKISDTEHIKEYVTKIQEHEKMTVECHGGFWVS